MSIKSISIVAAAAMSLFAGAAQAVTNGFANGGFELAGTFSPAASWLEGNAGYDLSTDAYSGSFALELKSPIDRAAVAVQNNVKDGMMPDLVVGDMPELSFWAKGSAPNGVLFALRYLDGDGNIKADSFNVFFQGQINEMSWSKISYNLGAVPVGASAAFLELVQFGGAAGTGRVLIDDVVLGVVPEPGTYALMLAGLVAVGAVARRRRAA
jgi:hypothetical protein